MPLGLMPDYLYTQLNASGQPLSGGVIYFYESGTFVPQTVYADAAGDTALGTSVTLSASGTAVIFLGTGSYRIWVKDRNGNQIAPWVDGITSTALAGLPGTTAGIAFVMNYGQVRTLTSNPDAVYVCGAYAEGDGGAGLFQMIPGSSLSDDNGIVLVAAASSGPYMRVFDSAIDPRWYGYTYTQVADQTTYFNAATAASARWGYDVQFTQPSSVDQSVTIPSGAGIHCTIPAYFTASGSVTFTFASGSRFSAEGITFGNNVQPAFGVGVCPVILLSWMGGSTGDVQLQKLASSSTQSYKVLLDVSTSLSLDPVFPANLSVDATAGSVGTYSVNSNLSIANLQYTGMGQIFSFPSASYIGTINIPNQVKPEWFGAKGNGSTNDSIALKASFAAGNVWLTNKYLCGTSFTNTVPVTLSGNLPNPEQVTPTETTSCIKIASGITISVVTATITANSVEIIGLSTGAAVTCGLFNANYSSINNVSVSSTGGVVKNTLFPGTGSFPISLVDVIDSCMVDTNTTINLSQYGKAKNNTLGGSSSYFHFMSTVANSVLTFQNNTTTYHLVHLNSTSTANVDAFPGDQVNSTTTTPGAANSVLLSNGVGTVNLGQGGTLNGTQLWNTVGGISNTSVSYCATTPNLTAILPGPWTTVTGITPTGNGTALTPSASSSFHWKYLEQVNVAATNITGSQKSSTSCIALLGGVLQILVTTPSGAASGAVLQTKVDMTGSAGTCWNVNKQINLPATSASEVFTINIPVIGGYWNTFQYVAADYAQAFSFQLDLFGSGLSGYQIQINAVHSLPPDTVTQSIWSRNTLGTVSTTALFPSRTFNFYDVTLGNTVLLGTINGETTLQYDYPWTSVIYLPLTPVEGTGNGYIGSGSWYLGSPLQLIAKPKIVILTGLGNAVISDVYSDFGNTTANPNNTFATRGWVS
jgi:hypothetical protein